jgi:hypothetical protein
MAAEAWTAMPRKRLMWVKGRKAGVVCNPADFEDLSTSGTIG